MNLKIFLLEDRSPSRGFQQKHYLAVPKMAVLHCPRVHLLIRCCCVHLKEFVSTLRLVYLKVVWQRSSMSDGFENPISQEGMLTWIIVSGGT